MEHSISEFTKYSNSNTFPSWPNLLQGVAEATKQLLTIGDYQTAINQALATLGLVTGVDRVYIFQIHPHSDTGEPAMSQRFEWANCNVNSEIDNPILQNLPFSKFGMNRWYEVLRSGNSIQGLTTELSADEKQLIEPQGILSILLVPIPVNGQLWGFIGFDDCHTDRQWSKDEEAVLMTTAATLGGVIFQRQVEEELRQERDFIAAVLDTAGALVLVLDRQGRIIRFNRACEQTTDYSYAEVQGKCFWDLFIIPSEIETVKTVFHQLQAGNFPITNQNYWVTKNGNRRLINWSNTAILERDRYVKYIIATGIDITEHYLAEEELRESERRLCKQNNVLMELAKRKTINSGDLNAAIQEITEAAARTLEIERASVWFYNQDRSKILCVDLYERSANRHSQGLELAAVNYPEYFKALETERTIAAADAYKDPRTREFSANYLTPIGVKSMLDAPIWLGGQMVGTVCHEEVEPGRQWSLEEENFAGSIADLVSLAIEAFERKKAEQQLLAAAERDRILAQIALRIRRSLNLEEILNTTVTEVRQFLQADRVLISHLDGNHYGQVFAESIFPGWEPLLGLFMEEESYVKELRDFFSESAIQAIDDVNKVSISPKHQEYIQRYQVKACLAVPIMLGDEFFGTLVAHQCSDIRHWQQSEIDLLEQLATQVAIAIQQAKLYQQVQDLNTNLEKQVEERTSQLKQRNQELQELNQLKDVFLHAVTHDLRTPVMGWLLVLKKLLNTPSPARQTKTENTILVSRNILERMVQSSDRQLQLINSLLEVHSSEVRGLVIDVQPVQLSQLFQAIIQDLEPLLVKNQATVHNLITSDLPVINADASQLWRVVENLFTNALNHNPPGLSLTLNATVQKYSLQPKSSRKSPINHAKFIRVSLQDNGIGMDRETREHLFELYVRGSHVRRSTGIGLGLYLCRQIINAHGGEIGAIGSPDNGTTFWFTLPI